MLRCVHGHSVYTVELKSITVIFPWIHLYSEFSLFLFLLIRSLSVVRNRARISPMKRERRKQGIRVFHLLATPVRFGHNERGGGGGAFGTNQAPYTFGLPLGRLLRRPFIRRPYLSTHVSSAIPAGAPSLNSYPSLVLSTAFVFVVVIRR